MEIYVANLDRGVDEADLKETFENYGEVLSAVLIRDKETRNSKGFGFIKMFNAIDAERAIDDLNGREVAGRNLVVKEAKPQEERTNFQQRESRSQRTFSNRFDDANSKKDRVKLEGQSFEEEDIPIQVQNEASFSKSADEEGYIKISFGNK